MLRGSDLSSYTIPKNNSFDPTRKSIKWNLDNLFFMFGIKEEKKEGKSNEMYTIDLSIYRINLPCKRWGYYSNEMGRDVIKVYARLKPELNRDNLTVFNETIITTFE